MLRPSPPAYLFNTGRPQIIANLIADQIRCNVSAMGSWIERAALSVASSRSNLEIISGTVTRIDQGVYLYLDDERGGFHWECFKKTA